MRLLLQAYRPRDCDMSQESQLFFKKNLNASKKPSEHPPHSMTSGRVSKGLDGNIGCRNKTSLNASKPAEHPPQVEECLKV